MQKETYFNIITNDKSVTIKLKGNWHVKNLDTIEKSFYKNKNSLSSTKQIILDISSIKSIDTGSMIFFLSMRAQLKKRASVHAVNIPIEFCHMFKLVSHFKKKSDTKAKHSSIIKKTIDEIGKKSLDQLKDFTSFLDFIGHSTIALMRVIAHPSTFRYKETAGNIYRAGVTALPIIALSAFLVGIVVAFQSAVQLQKYGANIFIVDMIGISIPRELAPLITAIIVAGRSGSAYTAQIGVMKITEEIDAMKTMGFEIFRFLVLPRMVAMIIIMPLLIFFADMVGIYGGLIVAKVQLGITPTQFLDRLHTDVALKHYLVGLFKGPFFAWVIAAVGCFRGFQVSGNTESIGRYTTMSVVNAIFGVIALDAIFSIIFTELGI